MSTPKEVCASCGHSGPPSDFDSHLDPPQRLCPKCHCPYTATIIDEAAIPGVPPSEELAKGYWDQIRARGEPISQGLAGPAAFMKVVEETAGTVVPGNRTPFGRDSHAQQVQDILSLVVTGKVPPKPGDDDYCPSSPNHEHYPDPDTFEAATGYDTDAEGGIVFQVYCRHCKKAQGSGLVKLGDINW